MTLKISQGFTLIELVIAVAIIGLLAAVSIPMYQDSVNRSKRSDAKNALIDLAQREESFYADNNAYTAELRSSTIPPGLRADKYGYQSVTATGATSQQCYYTITAASPAPRQFTLTAIPSTVVTGGCNAQSLKDTQCKVFTIDQTGTRMGYSDAGGTISNPDCWAR